MAIAIHLPRLRRPPRYERRPRIVAARWARMSLSRDRRWRNRGGSKTPGRILVALATLGILAALWFVYKPEPAPVAPPLAFPDFVAQTETTFPEALRGHTRAQGARLTTGQEVPVAVSLLLPTHALESASASPEALTRLSAPFVGAERAISGKEMGSRIARLADAALPAGVSRCYTYSAGAPKRVAISDTRKVRATPVKIAFNPEC